MGADNAHEPRESRCSETGDGEDEAGFAGRGVAVHQESESRREEWSKAEAKQDAPERKRSGVVGSAEAGDEEERKNETEALDCGFAEEAQCD